MGKKLMGKKLIEVTTYEFERNFDEDGEFVIVRLFDSFGNEVAGRNAFCDGDFDCSGRRLRSLEGCPVVIYGSFNCENNFLKDLKGAPMVVNGSFMCSSNLLTSLEGLPGVINGNLYCYNNQLKNIDLNIPQVSGFIQSNSYNK